MLRQITVLLVSFLLAFLVLTVSVLRIAQVKYVFSKSPSPSPNINIKEVKVGYQLPSAGTILPDSPLWPLKALRDQLWLLLTFNPSKKADLYLLFADKRLTSARILFKEGNSGLGISVLTKAEKYLQLADNEEKVAKVDRMNTSDFFTRYALSTLKHRQVMDEILVIAPDDVRPYIVKTEDYPKTLYNEAIMGLNEAHATLPQNPFQEN